MGNVNMSIIRNMIIDILVKSRRPLMAKEIAAALRQSHGLNISKREVNQILYAELARNWLAVNARYEWSMPVAKPRPQPQQKPNPTPNPSQQPKPQPRPQPRVAQQRPNPPPGPIPTPAPRQTPPPQAVVHPAAQVPRPQSAATTAQATAPQQNSTAYTVAYIGAVCLVSAVIVHAIKAPAKSPAQKPAPVPEYSIPYSLNRPEVQYKKPPPKFDVSVRGHRKEDGTYVKPHYRSPQNGLPQDNFSTRGNFNPYTGKPGTK